MGLIVLISYPKWRAATVPELAPTSPATLGAALRTARERAGLSLGEVARRTGLSKSLLSRAERDRCECPPTEAVLQRLGRQLGLNGDRLCLLAGRLPGRWQRLLTTHPDLFMRLFLSLQSRNREFEDIAALLLQLKYERDDARATVCHQALELAQLRQQLARLQRPSWSKGGTAA